MKSTSDISKMLIGRIEKTIWFLGLHAFLLILFLVFVDFMLGGFVFYKYVLMAEREEAVVTENIIKFNDTAYNTVLIELQTKEQSNQPPAVVQPSPVDQPQNSTSE